MSLHTDIEVLKKELHEAYETLRAIREGKVDAFVTERSGAYHVQTLSDADTPYRVLVESIREGALTVSHRGTVLYCNKPFAEHVGADPSQIVGRPLSRWVSVEQGFDVLFQRAQRAEVRDEGKLLCGAGTVHVAITACALPTDDGACVYCVVLHDLSDRVVAEQLRAEREVLACQRAELYALCSGLRFGVLLAERAGAYDFSNPVAERLLEEHASLAPVVAGLVEQVLDADVAQACETEACLANGGSDIVFRVQATPVSVAKGKLKAVVVIEDLTRERQAKREQFEQEQLRETFVGILGHDLRAPLMAIVTAAGLLERGGGRAGIPTQAARVRRGVERMSRLIDDMLDLTLSRIGGGIPLSRSDCDLSDVIRDALEEIQASAPDARFELSVVGDAGGQWDATRLSQVVTNLLANAIQYGDTTKSVRIALDGDQPGYVVLRVSNDGPAIPAELLTHIFDPFRRAAAERARGAGVGLGLYIAERIVSTHGGRISVCSNHADGTTFTLELPRRVLPS